MFDPFGDGGKKTGAGRNYTSPSQVAMGVEDHTPMANYIPGGSFGGKSVGKGTVVPRHKPGRGGGSLGYNPHKPPHRRVTVDPHVPGRAVDIDLSRINPDDVNDAFAAGTEFADEIMADPPEEMDGIEMNVEEGPRLAGYATVKLLATTYGAAPQDEFSRLSGQGPMTLQAAPGGESFSNAGQSRLVAPPRPVPPATTGAAKAASFGTANVGGQPSQVNIVNGDSPQGGFQVQPAATPPRPQAPKGQGPMSRFHPAPAPPRAQAQPQPAAHPQFQPAAPPPAQTGTPPACKVRFDFGEAIGEFPAQYHDVIRTKGGIVLVWDTRWPYGEPYSPEHIESQFAVSVEGHSEDYLVLGMRDTFTFESDGFRYYILGIIQTLPVA